MSFGEKCKRCGRFVQVSTVCICLSLGGAGKFGSVANAFKDYQNGRIEQQKWAYVLERSDPSPGFYRQVTFTGKFETATSTSTATSTGPIIHPTEDDANRLN